MDALAQTLHLSPICAPQQRSIQSLQRRKYGKLKGRNNKNAHMFHARRFTRLLNVYVSLYRSNCLLSVPAILSFFMCIFIVFEL